MTGRFGELFIILVIIFVLFGAGRLPKTISDLANSIKTFRKNTEEKD